MGWRDQPLAAAAECGVCLGQPRRGGLGTNAAPLYHVGARGPASKACSWSRACMAAQGQRPPQVCNRKTCPHLGAWSGKSGPPSWSTMRVCRGNGRIELIPNVLHQCALCGVQVARFDTAHVAVWLDTEKDCPSCCVGVHHSAERLTSLPALGQRALVLHALRLAHGPDLGPCHSLFHLGDSRARCCTEAKRSSRDFPEGLSPTTTERFINDSITVWAVDKRVLVSSKGLGAAHHGPGRRGRGPRD